MTSLVIGIVLSLLIAGAGIIGGTLLIAYAIKRLEGWHFRRSLRWHMKAYGYGIIKRNVQ